MTREEFETAANSLMDTFEAMGDGRSTAENFLKQAKERGLTLSKATEDRLRKAAGGPLGIYERGLSKPELDRAEQAAGFPPIRRNR
jgi:hypothetical protein